MKNYKLKLTIMLTLTTLVLASCNSKEIDDTNNNTSSVIPTEPTLATSDYIGMENAEIIAVKHAIENDVVLNFDETQVEKLESSMDLNDVDNIKYIVEFYVSDYKYEYEIHAKTGEILNLNSNVDEEYIHDINADYIEPDEAKNIAFIHSNVEDSNIESINVKLNTSNEVAVYDVEFYIGTNEFDYVIDAITGEILEFDFDAELFDVSISEETILSEAIGEEEAVNIARKDANAENTSNLFVKLEISDTNNPHYLVEFLSNNTQFSYEIHSSTGEILFRSSETDENAVNGIIVDQKDEESPYIGDGKAVVIAVNHAGADPTNEITIDLVIEGSKSRYHVGFFINNTEYQYEIDAINGKIMSLNKETKNYNNDSNTTTNNENMVIGDEAALDIALKFLGADSATFIKVDFSFDNGVAMYEIDFRIDNTEHSFDIDAITGAIIDYNKN